MRLAANYQKALEENLALAMARVAREVELPPRYSVTWSSQYEYLERTATRLRVVVPMTLAIIVLLLYLYFRNLAEVAILMASLPFALIWLLYLLDYHLSVASGVGYIALAGVAGSGTGSELMRRIATPMVGGMASAAVLTLIVIPAVYLLWKRREIVGRLGRGRRHRAATQMR